MRKIVIAMTGVFVFAYAAQLGAQSLKGSRATMRKQNHVAQKQDYTFLQTSRDVRHFVESGLLVPVKATKSLRLSDGVSFPYARPAVRVFAQRLAEQYKDACGERMVVTSLTRPLNRQPWNASDLSVHPAGMALDIRVSERRACRSFLEEALVGLESKGVIDATRERYPAHFHIAVFPPTYLSYVEKMRGGGGRGTRERGTQVASAGTMKIANAPKPQYASVVSIPTSTRPARHKVRSGESLWTIAKDHGVSVTALKNANDLRGSRIRVGQMLVLPS